MHPPSAAQHSRRWLASKATSVTTNYAPTCWTLPCRPGRFDRQSTVLTCGVILRSPACTPATRPACPMLTVKRLPVVPLVSPALTRRPCEKTVCVNTMFENSVHVAFVYNINKNIRTSTQHIGTLYSRYEQCVPALACMRYGVAKHLSIACSQAHQS